MTSSMSSGRLLMKSRLAGCGFWLERPLLVGCLAVHLNRQRRREHVCWCVLCAGCARVHLSCARSLCSMHPQFTSVWGATPSGFNFVSFTTCQMGL